ncbi:MAG TPA: squalene--hopene cyclase [Miltoncostaeaceae bacterium]|nr:squalene--hopene cyclase [Miltoncostaeaceae bacterium]
MPPLAAPDTLVRDARAAIERGREHLVGLQDAEGWWWGELESNATITAEHLFLLSMLGLATDEDRRKVAAELLATQRPDGSWPVWFEGPSDLSTAVEAYYALRVAGVPADDPRMIATRDLVRGLGGVNRTRFFTRLWLAVLGIHPWEALPALPPELIYLPARAPVSIYRFACWARQTFVALMVVLSLRPTYPLPVGLDELYLEEPGSVPGPLPKTPGRWTGVFERMVPLARRWERIRPRWLAQRSYRRIEKWICERQEADGSWGGIQPPWVYSLIALHALGRPLDDPVMERGLAGLGAFVIEENGRMRMQGCISPVWDTCLAAIALLDGGAGTDEAPVRRAVDWMLSKEITRFGDWHAIPRRGRPGGWSFEFANEWYPDTDDTAEVLIALVKGGLPPDHGAIRRGVDWLLTMQSSNGGWGSFDVDNDRRVMAQFPVCDFGETLDPPTEDVTAHVIEALVMSGLPADDGTIRRAVDYLKREQRPDGSWWGRWGVNHIYGTGAVLPALAAVGEDMSAPYVTRAVDWLAERQNADGGWGERCESYADPELAGRGPSTASQTAWALLALLAAAPDHPAVAAGVGYLVETQTAEGGWEEDHFTGTGFPGDFMIKYHLYRLYFPLTALGRFVA